MGGREEERKINQSINSFILVSYSNLQSKIALLLRYATLCYVIIFHGKGGKCEMMWGHGPA